MKNLTYISKIPPPNALVEAAKECGFSVHFADATHVHSDVEAEYFISYLSNHNLAENIMFGEDIKLYMILSWLSQLVSTDIHQFVGDKLITYSYSGEESGLYRITS